MNNNINIFKIVIMLIILVLCASFFRTNDMDFFSKDSGDLKLAHLKQHYKLTAISQNSSDYLMGSPYYTRDKKLVFFINKTYTNNPLNTEFEEVFNSYKNSPEWNTKYTFIEFKINNPINTTNSPQNEAFAKFCKECGTFCIFDLNTNTSYSEESLKLNKLNNALYTFYNH